MNFKKIKECILNFLSDLWDFLSLLLFLGAIYCIPSVLQLFSLSTLAFISYAFLMVLAAIFLLYALVLFILATKSDNANDKNRCLFTWIYFGGAALIGTIAANLAGIF